MQMKDKDIVGAPKASDAMFKFKASGPKTPLPPAKAVSAAKGAKNAKPAKKSPKKAK